MTTETMNMHKALVERKILPDRIAKLQNDCDFIATTKSGSKKIDGKSINEYKNDMLSNHQKMTDLWNRLNAIESAIIKSNGVTTVTINGDTMTVAEAIVRKKNEVARLKAWRDILANKYATVMNLYSFHSGDMLENDANEYVQSIVRSQGGVAEKQDEKFITALHDSYINNNEFELVDPLNVKDILVKLDDEIASIESDYDAALSVSNATTVIEFSY